MFANQAKIKSNLERLNQLSGVEFAVLTDETGFPISSTGTIIQAEKYSALLTSLKQRINSVLKELGLEGVTQVKLKTPTKELLITASNESNLIVVRKKE